VEHRRVLAGEKAIELAAVGDVREEIEEIARVARGEARAVSLRESPFPLGREVDEAEELREIERTRVLADAVIRRLVYTHGDRRAPCRAPLVAAVHLRVDETE